MDVVITDLDLKMVQKWKTGKKFQENFKKFIDKNGFLELEMKNDFTDLLSFLIESNVKISVLTSAGNPDKGYFEKVEYQKKQWLKNRGLNFSAIVVQDRDFKKNYSSPHALLIDDTEINCTEFVEAGGHAIHYLSAEKTLEVLKENYALRVG
jgi:hypothetical protein